MKGPKLVVYDEKELGSRISYSTSEENNDSKKYGNIGEIDRGSKRSQRGGNTSIPLESNSQKCSFSLTAIPSIVDCKHVPDL